MINYHSLFLVLESLPNIINQVVNTNKSSSSFDIFKSRDCKRTHEINVLAVSAFVSVMTRPSIEKSYDWVVMPWLASSRCACACA